MAIVASTKYPGQTDVDLEDFPFGKARNKSGSSSTDGTPLEKEWVNDIWGFLQSLLVEAGITPSGNPDSVTASQYKQALKLLLAPRKNVVIAKEKVESFLSYSQTTTGQAIPITNADAHVSDLQINDKLSGLFLCRVSTVSSVSWTLVVSFVESGSEKKKLLFPGSGSVKVIAPFFYSCSGESSTVDIVPKLVCDQSDGVAVNCYYGTGDSSIFHYEVTRP